jgi:hypothetical protein
MRTVDERCVAVLGMHRSGTSATAGLLIRLGLTGPQGADLIPASDSNELGHWESRAVHGCNARLFRALDCGGASPPPVTLRWDGIREYNELRSAALRWFDATYVGGPVMVKDPRLCSTLAFWREVLPAPMAAVFVLRNPLNVARSLQARDNIPMTLALAIWDRYIRSAAVLLAGLPTLVLEYDHMMSDPVATADEVSRFLNRVDISVAQATTAAASQHLDSALRHQSEEEDEYREMALVQRQVFEELARLKGVHDSWQPQAALPPAPLWVEDALRIRREFTKRDRELRKLMRSPANRIGVAVRRRIRHEPDFLRSGSA